MEKTILNRHTESFKINTYDVDFHNRVTPNTILGLMEEVATNHGKEIGFGYEESHERGFFWMLRTIKYDFSYVPKLDDHIEMTTWIVGISGLKVLRRFEFKKNNVVIGQGYNYWLMADIKKRKPIIHNYVKTIINQLIIFDEDMFKLIKVKLPKDMNFVYQKQVLNSDLDLNLHVNNAKYADMIINALPFDVLDKQEILSFQIDYLKECKLNDKLDISISIKDNAIYIEGKETDVSVFKSCIIT